MKLVPFITSVLLAGLLLSMSAGTAEAALAATSAVLPAEGTLQRLLPKQAKCFVLETIPPDNGLDVFEIESRDGQIVLRGNSGVAIVSALERYLKDYCQCQFSWDCGNQLELPKSLPPVAQKVRVVSPHRFRFAFNYCTHGYTMAWWDWPRWERELDFLALKGINIALIIEGQEAVWINTLSQFGYTRAELRQWLVLPTHQPWMFMSNMQDYGGPLSEELVQKRVELAQRIVTRMKELGMAPVLQGYYGIVPADFAKRFPEAKIFPQGNWGILKRPDMLSPTDPLFARVATAFYREQAKLYGTANFYAADPFHEGGSTQGVDLPACGRAIYAPMNGATWVLQAWQENPRQQLIDALDKNKLLVLDLWCEAGENWRKRDAFNGTPWLWSTIHNFGGNIGMGGRLDWLGQGPVRAATDPQKGRLSGIGALLEGSGTNPALWERFFDNSWCSGAVSLDAWVKDYCRRRYGAVIPAAEQSWGILAQTLYQAPESRMELPVNSVVCARPSLNPQQRARQFVTTKPYYDCVRVAESWRLLCNAAPQAAGSDGYRYDLADLGRQVLADLATRYHQQIVAAYKAKDAALVRALSSKMLGLIPDMDELLGTRPEFLLGPWLEDARRWAVTEEEKNRYERDARELITVWTENNSITDYANRQWSGLLSSYYYPRWELWLKALNDSLATGVALDEAAVQQQLVARELAWTHQTERFPTRARGDVVKISKRLLKKYSPDVLQALHSGT